MLSSEGAGMLVALINVSDMRAARGWGEPLINTLCPSSKPEPVISTFICCLELRNASTRSIRSVGGGSLENIDLAKCTQPGVETFPQALGFADASVAGSVCSLMLMLVNQLRSM